MVMNRIDRIFNNLRAAGAKGLMPYVTAGDPDLETTGSLLEAAARAGACVCELGFAFSDPIADGPVIAASMSYALDRGVRPGQVLDMVAQRRDRIMDMGLVAMVSYTLVHRLGATSFISDAAAAGIDGFIFPDLPLEQSEKIRDLIAAQGLIFSMLIAPTTPLDRAEKIARASSGFVYLLARAGITGEQKEISSDLPSRIERLRDVTDLPISVGFGISDADQVRQVVRYADAAIVGSALMRRVAEYRDQGSPIIVDRIGQFFADLTQGLHNETTIS